MRSRKIAALALSGTVLAGGAGGAIAAVSKDDAKKSEQAVLDDAAKRLNVTPDKLRAALAAAQNAQLDAAVKAGDLTREQADAIKQRREQSGRVLGGARGGPGMRGHRGGLSGHRGPGGRGMRGHRGGPGGHRGRGMRGMRGMRGTLLGDLASALGTTREKLGQQLRSGTSLADVAKAQGKSLSDVRSAVTSKAKTRLEEAVKDGDITRKQADAMLDRVADRLKAIESGERPRGRRHHGPKPPDGATRPGALTPDEAPPEGTVIS